MNKDIDSVNHFGFAVRHMEQACALYERLGFTLSPLSMHQGSTAPGEAPVPMATGNRCAVFPRNYIELLGVVNPGAMDWGVEGFLNQFQGAHVICFGCGDAETVKRRLDASGVKNSGVIALQRDLETGEGMRTARFDCVHFGAGIGAYKEGLVQAARHRNPEYVHQPRYLDHANGALALSEIVLVAEDPRSMADRYALLSGSPVRTDKDGSFLIALPEVCSLRFMAPEQVGTRLPGTLLAPAPAMVGGVFPVRDVEAARKLIASAGFTVVPLENGFLVPAEEALGVAHVFTQG